MFISIRGIINAVFNVEKNETVQSIKEKIIETSNQNIPMSKINLTFNGTVLQDHKKIGAYNISNGAVLNAATLGDILGGGGGMVLDFCDVSKQNTEYVKFSKKAKSYRQVEKGLNIFGKCKNKNCVAFNKTVIYPTGIDIGEFDIIKESHNCHCPECGSIIDPKTCGFYECSYWFTGLKWENEEGVKVDTKVMETTNKNGCDYFPIKSNGIATWIKLIAHVDEKGKDLSFSSKSTTNSGEEK